MRSLLLSAFVAAAAVAFPIGASAEDPTVCDAPVVSVLVYADGTVNIQHSGSNWTYLCNLDSTWRGVSPTTCATWVALLEKIKAKGGVTRFYYNFPKIPCNTLASKDPIKEPLDATYSYENARVPFYIGDL